VDILSEALEVLDDGFAESGIQVVKKFQEGIPEIHADANQLKQVFINLFSNAQQAMARGGSITTECRYDEIEGDVVISVRDTGGGISEDVITNIFNPFFTTKHSGTGLGLAITHRVVEMHGGHIQVKNQPGVGVTFVVSIPARVKSTEPVKN